MWRHPSWNTEKQSTLLLFARAGDPRGHFSPFRTRSYYWSLLPTQRHASCKTLALGRNQKYISVLRPLYVVDTSLPFG